MIRCLIIDDEPLSRQVLQSYAEDHPDLVVSGVCKDAMEAMKHLETEPVDLLLLDIHMPKLSGLSFYKSLQQKPQVVFTTAFSEHAVEGFELEATDYLLKPIAFDRFSSHRKSKSQRAARRGEQLENAYDAESR